MDQLTQDRWTELQFYYICSDVLAINNNIMDVMDFIDNMALFGQYQREHVKMLAHEILSSLRYRPSKEEFCLLCHMHKVPVKNIKARTGIHNTTLYNMLEANEKDPRMFYPRLQPTQLEIIRQFVEVINKFKQIGV